MKCYYTFLINLKHIDGFYPSLGMRQFLVTSQWVSDVTINRPNLLTYFSITIHWDLCAYKHTQQGIPDTKMSYIDKCTIVFDICIYLFGLSLNG